MQNFVGSNRSLKCSEILTKSVIYSKKKYFVLNISLSEIFLFVWNASSSKKILRCIRNTQLVVTLYPTPKPISVVVMRINWRIWFILTFICSNDLLWSVSNSSIRRTHFFVYDVVCVQLKPSWFVFRSTFFVRNCITLKS